MSLDADEIREILVEHLPEGTRVVSVPLSEFMDESREHPYIQAQIKLGVYEEETLEEDFLSGVRSLSLVGLVEYCPDILANHMEGVPRRLCEAYIKGLAIHEAFHLQAPIPLTADEVAQSEVDAANAVKKRKKLHKKVEEFEAQSPPYQRVYERLRKLGLI